MTNDKFTFDSYSMDNEEIVFDDIMKKLKGGKTQLIIELSGIWFAGGKYGCTWKMISGKFQISQNMKAEFIEDSDVDKIEDEEEEEDEDISQPATEIAKLENSDEEEEEGDENDVKPTPPPAAVKKGGRGAKK